MTPVELRFGRIDDTDRAPPIWRVQGEKASMTVNYIAGEEETTRGAEEVTETERLMAQAFIRLSQPEPKMRGRAILVGATWFGIALVVSSLMGVGSGPWSYPSAPFLVSIVAASRFGHSAAKWLAVILAFAFEGPVKFSEGGYVWCAQYGLSLVLIALFVPNTIYFLPDDEIDGRKKFGIPYILSRLAALNKKFVGSRLGVDDSAPTAIPAD